MIYILLAIIFQSLAIIFGKAASITIGAFDLSSILNSKFYFLSLACLFGQAIVWQFALQKVDLNRAYFYMSAVYFAIMLSSYFIFHEKITIFNLAGAAIILIGITNLVTSKNV